MFYAERFYSNPFQLPREEGEYGNERRRKREGEWKGKGQRYIEEEKRERGEREGR